ncbi:TolC family protein [Marinimicrobium sp. C6131]|uniref:TolC family protein n=1 Tax=Marinimicrobium sp. C6131 TaxID=3022676 RepID=UPI00223DC8E3|nr:TolC family protein [Marinimicrobium sp. C6131]UZJ45983.1 TolC family protein [Marinimicrobium sp. C6131]
MNRLRTSAATSPATLLVALVLHGCASLEPPDYTHLDQTLAPLQPEPLLGSLAQIQPLEAQEREARLEPLLAEPLTPISAQQLALINSPQVRAELAGLGIAQAESLQTRLLRNPTLAVGALRPEGGGRWQLDLGISQSLLDLFTRGLRQQLAEEALAEAQLQLLERLHSYLYQVQEHYFDALSARHQASIAEQSLAAARASHDLAKVLFEAGNLKEVTLLSYRDQRQRQERQWRAAQTREQQARLRLAQQLGLTDVDALILPDSLPEPDDADRWSSEPLIEHALAHRLDLALLRQTATVQQRRLNLIDRQGPFTELELGLNAERETDGSIMAGPEFAISLPFADRNQAHRARLEAGLQQTEAQQAALRLAIRTDIQQTLLDMERLAQDIRQLADEVIPQWQQQVALTLEEYNFMLTGAFDLISAKEHEFDAWREHGEALEAYWLSRTRLALASAHPLPIENARPTPLPEFSNEMESSEEEEQAGHGAHREHQSREHQHEEHSHD